MNRKSITLILAIMMIACTAYAQVPRLRYERVYQKKGVRYPPEQLYTWVPLSILADYASEAHVYDADTGQVIGWQFIYGWTGVKVHIHNGQMGSGVWSMIGCQDFDYGPGWPEDRFDVTERDTGERHEHLIKFIEKRFKIVWPRPEHFGWNPETGLWPGESYGWLHKTKAHPQEALYRRVEREYDVHYLDPGTLHGDQEFVYVMKCQFARLRWKEPYIKKRIHAVQAKVARFTPEQRREWDERISQEVRRVHRLADAGDPDSGEWIDVIYVGYPDYLIAPQWIPERVLSPKPFPIYQNR